MNKIDFSYTKINNGFWKIKQDMLKSATLYAVYDRFVETGRFKALACDFDGEEKDAPHIFWDSDVAKWIEGAAYILKEKRDEKLEAIIDDAVDKIIKNSDENGYFNSHYLVAEQEKRFKNRDCHELYCAGHLIEAAVAYNEATGKDAFLKSMCKFADYIEKVFKTEKTSDFSTPGHPEIELALVRLFDATGEKRYLELSKFFVDEHGKKDNADKIKGEITQWAKSSYNQDNVLLRQRTEAEGHCVRALYLFCGMADIAEKYNDKELFSACEKVFDDIAKNKMYITGGLGSTHLGEAFSVPYYLPNRTAYAETCAAIAMALFCKRMQKTDINSKYADMAERVVYNGFLSGISMDGKAFFYTNPLEIDPVFNNINPSTEEKEYFPITQRPEIFNCSCCPPNVVRFIPSIADLMYTYDDETIYVHQYINSETECGNIKISQKTDYPANGKITLKCTAPQKKLAFRVPGWCKSFFVNTEYEIKNGYAFVELCGKQSVEIKIDFDMPTVFIKSNAKVHENAGRIAVMRGPVVYCGESKDNGNDLKSVKINTSAAAILEDNEFILPSLRLEGFKEKDGNELYFEIGDDYEKFDLKLIPYYAFANRGECEMAVWFLRG